MADSKIMLEGHWIKLLDNGDGTYSFATESTPGTAIIGKVGIDQTTPGTTNLVYTKDSLTLYGASTATRPLATAVAAGTVFVVVASPVSATMSDGTNWVVI